MAIEWDRDPNMVKVKLANAYHPHLAVEAERAAAITYSSTGIVLEIEPRRKSELKAKLFDTSTLLSTERLFDTSKPLFTE